LEEEKIEEGVNGKREILRNRLRLVVGRGGKQRGGSEQTKKTKYFDIPAAKDYDRSTQEKGGVGR